MKVEIRGFKEFTSAAELRAHYARLKPKRQPIQIELPIPKPPPPKLATIIKAVCVASGLSEEVLVHYKASSFWRAIAMFVAREHNITTAALGSLFHVDPSTAVHAHGRIKNRDDFRTQKAVTEVNRWVAHFQEIENAK